MVDDVDNNPLDPFGMGNGSLDDGTGPNAKANRIGAQITVKNITLKLFIGNALGRLKVFYYILLYII